MVHPVDLVSISELRKCEMPSPCLQNAAALATIVYVFATLGMLTVLIATARYAKGQLESVERARQLSCLRDLSDKWSSQLIREARQLIEKETNGGKKPLQRWIKTEPDAQDLDKHYKIIALANFFEDMGLLEKDGQLTLEQVADRFSNTILYYERLLDPLLVEQRKGNPPDPTVLVNFTKLADKLKNPLALNPGHFDPCLFFGQILLYRHPPW
jgi:hypothetical protein